MKTASFTIFSLFFFSVMFAQQSSNMNLLGGDDVSSQTYNDCWGYVDTSGNEYAVIGSLAGIYFYDVTNPSVPVIVDSFFNGTRSGLTMVSTTWRDFKSYDHYMYAVSEGAGEGVIIFDMQYLPDSVVFVNQNKSFFGKAHNCFIDTSSARLYALGTNTRNDGIVVLDLSVPETPTQLSSVSLSTGYVHDAFVVNDTVYASHGYNGLTVWDFSGSLVSNPADLGSYNTSGYNHSSWRTDDGQYLVYAEEVPRGKSLRLIDVSDLGNINLVATFKFPLLAPNHTNSTAHNPFIIDSLLYVSYYEDGVQIMNIADPANPSLSGYYDTYPTNTAYTGYNGCWGVYPFLPSGNIIASDRSTGLYVLEYVEPLLSVELSLFKAEAAGERVNLSWQTETELNFSHFELQHSIDGRQFSTIAKVQSRSATDSYSQQQYTYQHDPTLSSLHYYRLLMVDKDGQTDYSEIRAVNLSTRQSELSIYPTLLTGSEQTIQVKSPSPIVAVRLFDPNGSRILEKAGGLQEAMSLGLRVALRKGWYVIEVETVSGSHVQKLMVTDY